MKFRTGTLGVAAILTLGVGAPYSLAQNSDRVVVQPGNVSSACQFRSTSWLTGRNVVNRNGEKVADVSNLILDRGSGRIEYCVIKAGSVLGIGGKPIAIPYSAFGWNAEKDEFVLDSTTDQLKTYPEFDADSWSAMMESKSKAQRKALHEKFSEDGPWMSDPYAGSFDAANRSSVEGEVTKVEHYTPTNGSEQIIITVKANDGTTKRVALGPSWFITAGTPSPMRGDKVRIETLELPRDPDQTYVATRIVRGDQDRRLRGTSGGPLWSTKNIEADGKSYESPYWRYVLLTHLKGMRVDCRGTECGKVNDVIVEKNSGEVAFLSIDPNENFLGIGDKKRLVPWSVVTVALDGTVRVDASKEMILASAETPRDIKDLDSRAQTDVVYHAYDVPSPRFDARTDQTPMPRDIKPPAERR